MRESKSRFRIDWQGVRERNIEGLCWGARMLVHPSELYEVSLPAKSVPLLADASHRIKEYHVF